MVGQCCRFGLNLLPGAACIGGARWSSLPWIDFVWVKHWLVKLTGTWVADHNSRNQNSLHCKCLIMVGHSFPKTTLRCNVPYCSEYKSHLFARGLGGVTYTPMRLIYGSYIWIQWDLYINFGTRLSGHSLLDSYIMNRWARWAHTHSRSSCMHI